MGNAYASKAHRPLFVGHPKLSGASRLSLHPSLCPGNPLTAICPQDSFWKHLVCGLHLGTGLPAATRFSGLEPTFVVSNALHQPRQGLLTCGSVTGLVPLNPAQICRFTSLWAFQPYRKASGILPTSLSCLIQRSVQNCLQMPGIAEFIIKPSFNLKRESVKCRAK